LRVLAVVGTSRKNGLVSRMCEKVLEGAADNGHETELINLYDYNIGWCTGCWACADTGTCVLKDDFAAAFAKVEEADAIVLGSPCYWGNVSGIMKNFFDRHIGCAMRKPPLASQFPKMRFWRKLRELVSQMKDFGPHPHLRGKRFVIVVAMTAPFPASHVLGDLPQTVRAMKIYVSNLKGKLIGKLIFTDTLFRFMKNKEERVMKRAYEMGRRIFQG